MTFNRNDRHAPSYAPVGTARLDIKISTQEYKYGFSLNIIKTKPSELANWRHDYLFYEKYFPFIALILNTKYSKAKLNKVQFRKII